MTIDQPVSREHRVQPGTGFAAQLTLLVALAFAIPAQLYLAIPLAGRIEVVFGVDASAAAWTGGAFSLAYAVGFLIFGPLSDRVGRKPVLVVGTLAMAVTTELVTLGHDLTAFAALRALQGFSAATFAPAALAYVADRVPGPRRPVALSLLTTGLLGAGLLGQVFGQFVAGRADWRWAFWPAGVVYALAAGVLWMLLDPVRPAAAQSWRQVLLTMGRLFGSRGPVAVFTAAITVFGGFVAMYAVINSHLRAVFGFDHDELLMVQAVGALGLAVGPLLTRVGVGKEPRFQATLGFLLAATGLSLAQASAVLVAVVAGSVVFVAGISLVVPGLVGTLRDLAPRAAGAAIAVNTFILFVGASLGQLLAAHAAYPLMLGLLTAAVLLAALVVATLACPPTRDPSHERRTRWTPVNL